MTLAVQGAGTFSMLVEAVPPEVTEFLRNRLAIPDYGIGAEPADGQVLTCGDMMGMFQTFTPKFVKKYACIAEIEIQGFQRICKGSQGKRIPF